MGVKYTGNHSTPGECSDGAQGPCRLQSTEEGLGLGDSFPEDALPKLLMSLPGEWGGNRGKGGSV